MTDTFTDLVALEAHRLASLGGRQEDGFGSAAVGQLRKVANRPFWTWPGCPADPTSVTMFPSEVVSDARVQAAIAASAYSVFEVDALSQPVAVIPSTSMWAGRPPLRPADVGTARELPPVTFRFNVYRAGTLLGNDTYGSGQAYWSAAWAQEVIAEPAGGNLQEGLLVFRLIQPYLTWVPTVGDVVSISNVNYLVTGSNALAGSLYDVSLKRPAALRP